MLLQGDDLEHTFSLESARSDVIIRNRVRNHAGSTHPLGHHGVCVLMRRRDGHVTCNRRVAETDADVDAGVAVTGPCVNQHLHHKRA